MKLAVVIHEAEEGGYWAEVPAISGCATQGESLEELLDNIYEAVEGCLSVEMPRTVRGKGQGFLVAVFARVRAVQTPAEAKTGIADSAVVKKAVTGKEFRKMPESHGWELKRITGMTVTRASEAAPALLASPSP